MIQDQDGAVLNRLRRSDEGISLIETVVAMLVFAVFAAVSGKVLVDVFDITKDNTQRTQAANLAQRQIDAVRGTRAIDISDSSFVVTPAPVINGTTYTVRQSAAYVSSQAGQSVCTGTSDNLAYKRVTVTVTWPGMGSIKPVRNDTLKVLGLAGSGSSRDEAGVDLTKAVAAVLVKGPNGAPQEGIDVTLSPTNPVRTAQTGADGCVVFTGLTPGNYRANLNKSGYVDTTGTQVVQSSVVGIDQGKVGRFELSYAPAGSLSTTFQPVTNYPAPPPLLGLTLNNSEFPTVTHRAFNDCSLVTTAPRDCVTGTPRLAQVLYPGKYGVFAGTCADAATSDSSVTLTSVPPAGTAARTVPLAGLDFKVTERTGVTPTNRNVYAVHVADDYCTAGESIDLGSGIGQRRASIPQGTYRLALNATGANPPAAGWPQVTLTAGAASGTVIEVTVP